MKRFIVLVMFLCVIFQIKGQEFTFRESRQFDTTEFVFSHAEISPFQEYFVYSLKNNTFRIFDQNWNQVFEHYGNPVFPWDFWHGQRNFTFTPDGEYLIYGRYNGSTDIALIRLSDRHVVQILDRHSSYVSDVTVSFDGNFLSSCGLNGELIIWKWTGDGYEYQSSDPCFEDRIIGTSFSFDDKYLVAVDSYSQLKLFVKDADSFELLKKINRKSSSSYSVRFRPEKNEFVLANRSGLYRYKIDGEKVFCSDSIQGGIDVRHPIDFSPKGKYLAVPYSRQLNIYRVYDDSLSLCHTIYRHIDDVTGVSFTEDGRFLVSHGKDKKAIVWEIEGAEATDKYTVSSYLNRRLSLAQRRALVPDVTSAIMEKTDSDLAAPRDEFEKTVDYDKRKEELSDRTLGLLQEEMEKMEGMESSGSTVSFSLDALLEYEADLEIYKVRMLDTEAGVRIPVEAAKALKLHWEDALIKADKKKPLGKHSYVYDNFRLIHPKTKKKYEVLPLENPFQILEKGRVAGAVYGIDPSLNFTEEEGARITNVEGTTYALLFGGNVYDSWDDLSNPVHDVRTIAAELNGNYGVKTELVLNASLEETAAKIREFALREYGEKDNLMIFFAGHGIYDDVFKEGYLISKDSKFNDAGKTSYLSHSNLRTMVNNIDCPHIFLVMDVCFGGTFDPLVSKHRGAPNDVYANVGVEQFVERKLKYKTRLYLTSGGKEYVKDGRPGFHSPFARKFIESLRHYGGNDGVLTTGEILQFVEKIEPAPVFGEFGDNEPGSDFIFVFQK